MLEITDEFVEILRYDADIISYTGSDVNDMRIYSWNPPFDIIYTSTYTGAIFIRDTSAGRIGNNWSYPSQIPDMMYYFAFVSPDKTIAQQIEERIRVLLDMYHFDTLNFRVGVITLNNIVDGINEGTPTNPLYSRVVSFSLREVFTR